MIGFELKEFSFAQISEMYGEIFSVGNNSSLSNNAHAPMEAFKN